MTAIIISSYMGRLFVVAWSVLNILVFLTQTLLYCMKL